MPDEMVAGLVLASGMSQRFGEGNKLLVPIQGEPLVRRTVRCLIEGGLEPVLVVVGHQANEVREALLRLPVAIVDNPDFRQGQSRALVAGINHLPPWANAVVIAVGDQPWLSPQVIRALVRARQDTGSPIVVPLFDSRRGNPVLFNRSLFPELLTVTGDQGGRAVVQAHAGEVCWVPWNDARAGLDIDTYDEYLRLSDDP